MQINAANCSLVKGNSLSRKAGYNAREHVTTAARSQSAGTSAIYLNRTIGPGHPRRRPLKHYHSLPFLSVFLSHSNSLAVDFLHGQAR